MTPKSRAAAAEYLRWTQSEEVLAAHPLTQAFAAFEQSIRAEYEGTASPPADVEQQAREILEDIYREGMSNHNTRCRSWWPAVSDFIAALKSRSEP